MTLILPSIQAATIDDFEGGPLNTPAVAQTLGAGSGPSVITEGINKILHLLDGVGGQNNIYSYELSDPGAYETIQGSFDFRIQPGTAGLADGLGLVLIPTSLDPFAAGPNPNPLAEKPDLAGAFGIGVDVYPGINNISAHFGAINGEVNPSYVSSFRDNLVFNRLVFSLQRVGNATNATISILNDSLGAGAGGTPVKIMETVIPNMLPYENRVQFGGRTGGENLKADIDNLNVTYSNPFVGGLPAAPSGHMYQDFDSTGTTSYRVTQSAGSDATTFRPGVLIKAPDAGSTGHFLRIVNDNVNGQSNRVAFDHGIDTGASNSTEITRLDLRFNSTDAPADGMGLLFLATSSIAGFNMTNNGIDSSEEPNHPNMLGVGFDVYDNTGPGIVDKAPAVSLHWNGLLLTDVLLPASFALNQFHRVEVIRETVPNGLNVTVNGIPNVNGVPGPAVTLIDHFFVEGASNYDYRLQVSGRTGGLNADHDIDNIVSSQITKAPLARTETNFDHATGSGWKGYVYETGAGPDIRNDFAPNGNYLRLAHDTVNGQRNAIAFDKQIDGTLNGRTKITADVDFRAINADPIPSQPADGFSLLITPTTTYGNTGPGAASFPGFIAEKPNVPGVFGIGFDVYNGPGQTINEATVHWNNNQYASLNIDPLQLDLLAGVFHHLHLELEDTDLGTLVDLILTPDIFGVPGTPVVVFQDLLIDGMDLYDYRFEFAARTGGLNLGVDIDNVLVQTIPEPGSAVLVALGALLASRRRRRS
jgi:hypothetical protein